MQRAHHELRNLAASTLLELSIAFLPFSEVILRSFRVSTLSFLPVTESNVVYLRMQMELLEDPGVAT